MSWVLIALGILSTFGPASGSVEGMIYTPVPIRYQRRSWLEVVPQVLLLSGVLSCKKKWLNWVLGVLFFFVMGMPILGLLTAAGERRAFVSMSEKD